MEEGTGENFDISDVLRVTNDKRLRKSHGSMKTGKTPAQEVQSVNETVPIHVCLFVLEIGMDSRIVVRIVRNLVSEH